MNLYGFEHIRVHVSHAVQVLIGQLTRREYNHWHWLFLFSDPSSHHIINISIAIISPSSTSQLWQNNNCNQMIFARLNRL